MAHKYGGSDAVKGVKDVGMKESDLGRSGFDRRGLITFKEH